MRIISVLNMKGGVGKTTLAVNVAYALAAFHGKRVLLVDMDPQSNASTSLMHPDIYLAFVNDPERSIVLDIFRPRLDSMNLAALRSAKRDLGDQKFPDFIHNVYQDLHESRLDIIPSNLILMEVARETQYGVERKLRNFLVEKAQGYDFVFIDCPPTISFFTTAAVLASTDYLIPVKPDPLSSVGLPLVERWLQEFSKDVSLSLNFIGIVLCMVGKPQTLQMRSVIDETREKYPGKVFKAHLRQGTEAAKATGRHMSILESFPKGGVASDIREITQEFMNRIKA